MQKDTPPHVVYNNVSPYVDPASNAVCTTPPPDEPSAMEITASQSVIIEINDTIMNNLNTGKCEMIVQYSCQPAVLANGFRHYVTYLCCTALLIKNDSFFRVACQGQKKSCSP